jgi:hypothetical protein
MPANSRWDLIRSLKSSFKNRSWLSPSPLHSSICNHSAIRRRLNCAVIKKNLVSENRINLFIYCCRTVAVHFRKAFIFYYNTFVLIQNVSPLVSSSTTARQLSLDVSADEEFACDKPALGNDKERRSVLLSSNFFSRLQF